MGLPQKIKKTLLIMKKVKLKIEIEPVEIEIKVENENDTLDEILTFKKEKIDKKVRKILKKKTDNFNYFLK